MKRNSLTSALVYSALFLCLIACASQTEEAVLDHNVVAANYYQEDKDWYLENIPFFECSDRQIEQVYYYRWKLYKAHIRNVGPNEFIITEFIDHVGWDREPWCTINAASMHHIYEGRWLRDSRYMDGYINYLFRDGGNDRRYSESVAEATYSRYLVDGDSAFVVSHLDSMHAIYQGWFDHYDATRSLYYIPAMPDATEYTIASVDASGGKDGFEGGDAFRPTINSYMYGNASAIARIARLKGQRELADAYNAYAVALSVSIQNALWNPSLQHFTDRYKVDNQYVHNWDFIRGRELAGFAPWYFNLPPDTEKFNAAWAHIKDTAQLLGKYGFRTNEPSYEYYFKQFVYFQGQRGSQWNGPSWPYQSSQVLTAMANVLNNYHQEIINNSDYVKSLRLFSKQHYLPNGKINLVENYDPNLGGPIVYYYWSNHYNHSSFNNLIISGLCGIRPSEGNTLTINPIVDESIAYFCLENVKYRGHEVTVIYDRDGTKYNKGKGVAIIVDGKKAEFVQKNGKYKVTVGSPILEETEAQPLNVALNIRKKDFPVPSASINSVADSLYQAIDGRIWYFPEVRNRWATTGSGASSDWYALDFGKAREISAMRIYPYADKVKFDVPADVSIEYFADGKWVALALETKAPLLSNTMNELRFGKVSCTQVRINFAHSQHQVAISEIEVY